MPTSSPTRERERRRPTVIVAERVADERADRAERGRGEVQDARHAVDDDDRQRDERGERAGRHAEQDEPQRRLAEELSGDEHGHFSSLNGFVASPNGVTRTYLPSSTLITIACREKRRNADSDAMSGNAFLLKSNGAISGRLIGRAFATSTSFAESSVAISAGGSFVRCRRRCARSTTRVTAGLISSPFASTPASFELLQHLLDAGVVRVRRGRLLRDQVDAVGLGAELLDLLGRHQGDRGVDRDVVRRDLLVGERVDERHHLVVRIKPERRSASARRPARRPERSPSYRAGRTARPT